MRYSLIAADASISEGRRYPAGGRGSKRECEIEDCVIYKAQEVTSVPLDGYSDKTDSDCRLQSLLYSRQKGDKHMKILVIPDIHLKPWIFDRAENILRSDRAERAVCLMGYSR